MIRNFALAALLMTGLAACMGGGDPTLEPNPIDPGDALENPTDGFENEIETE